MIPHSSDVAKALFRINNAASAEEMLAVWASTKREISWLLDNDYPLEAQCLVADYAMSFNLYKHVDETVTAKVVAAFPVNDSNTLKLLGISAEIDTFILKHKVKVDQLTHRKNHGFRELLSWAVQRQQLEIATSVVVQIARNLVQNHPGGLTGWCEGGHGMLRKLIDKDVLVEKYNDEIDEALASIMVVNPDYRKDGGDMIRMAQFGLKKTLFKMMSVGLFRQLRTIAFTPEEVKQVLDILPENPTAQEWHWIQLAIDHPGFSETILFDPTVDMQDYIHALRTTDFKLNRVGHNLSYAGLVVFQSLLTPDHLTTSDRKIRARMLVNAVCNEENLDRKKDAGQMRAELKRLGYHDCVARMCDQTKVSMLEDELGM